MPVMGAGMTAMWVTPSLGTWVLDSPGAGGQTGRRAEGFSRSLAPTSHGPGSQARCAQGQEGLGVPRLRLRGDRQAVGCRPPTRSPKPHTLASASARASHRGEFPGQPVPPWRGRGGHSRRRWSPPPSPPSGTGRRRFAGSHHRGVSVCGSGRGAAGLPQRARPAGSPQRLLLCGWRFSGDKGGPSAVF